MEKNNESYPLRGVKLGSTFKNGEFRQGSVFDESSYIGTFDKSTSRNKYMSGNSRFVHSAEMNKGTFGLNVTGGTMVRVEFAIAGYVGRAVATSTKVVTTKYNANLSVGTEYIDTNKLKVNHIINALKPNIKEDLLEVLDNYNELIRQADSLLEPTSSLTTNIEKLSSDLSDAFDTWMNSVNTFLVNNDEGFVTSILWGAFGIVEMEIISKASSDDWNFGGRTDLSVAGVGIGVKVGGSYDGSRKFDESTVDVNIRGLYTGEAISSIVDEWERSATKMATAELGNTDMLNLAPKLEIPKDIRVSAPKFVEPSKDPKLADKIGKIKDLKGLELFAKAKAFDDAKKDNNDLSLQDFLNDTEEPITDQERTQLIDTLRDISEGDEEVFEAPKSKRVNVSQESYSMENTIDTGRMKQKTKKEITGKTEKSASGLDDNFVPLGALLCNWTDIFPWLSSGFDNRFNELSNMKETLKWRSLIQDSITLSIIYRTAHAAGMHVSAHASAEEIADAFSQMAFRLQEKEASVSYAQNMADSKNGLVREPKLILDTWLNNAIFRKAELGFGVIHKPNDIKYSLEIEGRSIWKPCNFDNKVNNYVIFKSFTKFLPIILPDDGSIRAFNENGFFGILQYSADMFSAPRRLDTYFHRTDGLVDSLGLDNIFHAFNFKIDKENNCLIDTYISIRPISLYPIPLSALDGVKSGWKGGLAGAPNISSFEDLNRTFAEVSEQLKNRKKWSFSTDNFKDIKYSESLGLNRIHFDEQYLGVVPKPPGMKVFSR